MPAIRQQISIAASPKQVWNMLTTNDGLEAWLVDEARVEARVGGRVVWISEGDDGEPLEERGIFHELRPMRKIEIAWDSIGGALTKGTRVQFQLARHGGETRLALLHSGAGFLDEDEQRAEVEANWKAALKSLRSALEGE
jgi:uncharacterized protein YndB with AHSA1/START domain